MRHMKGSAGLGYRTRNPKFLLALTALLALASLGAWFFWLDQEAKPLALLQGAEIPGLITPGDKPRSEAGVPRSDQSASIVVEEARLDSNDIVRYRNEQEEPLLEVEVFSFDNELEQRAAGARVVVLFSRIEEYLDPGSHEARFHSNLDESIFSVGGREFTCNVDGRVLLPLGSLAQRVKSKFATFQVQAFSKDMRFSSDDIKVGLDWLGKFRKIQPPPSMDPIKKLRIQLHPHQSVTVFVHDRKGRGVAEVPIRLYDTASWPRTSGAKKLMGAYPGTHLMRTGPDGRCTFDFPQTAHFKKFKIYCRAGFSFPHGDHVQWSRQVTEEHLSGKEVELELPPTGSVEVEICGGSEEGWMSKDFFVSLNDGANPIVFNIIKRGITSNLQERRSFLSQFKKTIDHKTLFDWVGLGLEFEVVAIMGGTWGIAVKNFSGPVFPGESVRVLLPPPPPDPTVTGVVLDLDGRPAANRALIFYGGGIGTGLMGLRTNQSAKDFLGHGTTDALGRFSVALPPTFVKGSMKELMIVPTENALEEWPSCVIDLPPSFSEGTCFLGEHRLEQPPLIAEGFVVDQDGRPAKGAEVYCLRPGRLPQHPWVKIHGASSLTDPEGRWTIYKHIAPGELRVQAAIGEAAASKMLVAVPGTKGLTLILEPAGVGGIEGRIMVSDPLHLERGMIRIDLIPRSYRNEGVRRNISRTISKDGTVSWTSVPVGLYEFRASVMGDSSEPLAFVAGLRVEAGQVNREMVQGPIDLRGMTEEVCLAARDPDGNPIPARRLWVRNAPGARQDSEGKGLIILKRAGDAPFADVVPLDSPDSAYLPTQVKCIGTEVEFVLQPKPSENQAKKKE